MKTARDIAPDALASAFGFVPRPRTPSVLDLGPLRVSLCPVGGVEIAKFLSDHDCLWTVSFPPSAPAAIVLHAIGVAVRGARPRGDLASAEM
jgi:hypothetical protein